MAPVIDHTSAYRSFNERRCEAASESSSFLSKHLDCVAMKARCQLLINSERLTECLMQVSGDYMEWAVGTIENWISHANVNVKKSFSSISLDCVSRFIHFL